MPPTPDLRDVDRAARTAWSATVAQAVSWMPLEWRPALAWCDGTHERVPGTASNPTLLPTLGQREWRDRWPPDAQDDPSLPALALLFTKHLARFRLAAVHEAPALKREFQSRLLATLRQHPMEPVAAFAWLAIAALDLERLRGEIERRIAFPAARIAA
jgi:hypothetical protein